MKTKWWKVTLQYAEPGIVSATFSAATAGGAITKALGGLEPADRARVTYLSAAQFGGPGKPKFEGKTGPARHFSGRAK